MRIACWIPKATNTHKCCVILIAFPLLRWLHKRASVLRYTYFACLVVIIVSCLYTPVTSKKGVKLPRELSMLCNFMAVPYLKRLTFKNRAAYTCI
jgi:hypothetical protein